MLNYFTKSSRTSRVLRAIVSSLLTLTAINFSLPAANALPGAPLITSITSDALSGPVDVTVNFIRATPSDPQPNGYIYSTDNGSNWAQCDTAANCTWDGSASRVVVKKLSTDTPRLQAGVTYQIVIAECSSGTANTLRKPTANISQLGLQDCGAFSGSVTYVGGTSFTASTPTISTSSTIANGAASPQVTVTSSGFDTAATSSDFTFGYGTTGLTGVTSISFTDTTSATITFTGTAAAGTLTIQAKTSAYSPAPSSASNTLSITVPATFPGAPTSVDSSTVGGTEVRLTWLAPASNGGAAITDYLVQYKVNPSGNWETFTATASTSLFKLVTGLTSSTAYLFKVAAKNSVGYGPFSSDFGPVTTGATPTVPETPTAVSASNATSSSLDVAWTAPANNGGATILDYKIERSTDGTTWVSAATGASSGHTVTGLSASTSYYFRVAARNSVGYGPFSDSSTAVSTSAAPAPSGPAPVVISPPQIIKLNKDKVCARGDDKLVIHGNNLDNASVTIDGKPAKIRNNSSQVIGVTLEEGLEGLRTIKVTTSAGSDSISVLYKMVDKTAFKVFDIPYIYKGGSFYYQFEAFGENTFRVTGKMPAGLVLNVETGEISGIPTEEGKFNFVLHADGLCGNDNDVIKLDVDKEIPNAISHRIKFTNPKSKKIVGTAAYELNKFLREIKEISPLQIQPVIYITGGAPENEPEVDSQSAKDRRDSLCDIMIKQDVIGQTVLGLFDGEEGEIEIFVYWPVVR